MKKLFLISSFCDSEEKKEVLTKNLKKIKELGYDTLLLTPISLDKNIIDLCDYYYQTKENPVSSIEEKTYIHWSIITNDKGEQYRLERFFPEYGWAALYQNKKLTQIGLTFDYDIYYHIIYDTIINDGLIEEINSNKVNTYYSNKSTNGDINEFSLHYIPLNKDGMISFEKFLDRERYVTSHDLTHDFMLKWANQNDILKSDFIVEEYINFYTDINFFSIYNGNEVKLFFEKFELNQEKNKFICYNKKTESIKVIINDDLVFDQIMEKIPIETNSYTSEINKIQIQVNGNTYDCTDSYNKVGRNKIFYL